MNGRISRKTLRLKHYDYSSNGLYFITVCSYGKQNYFGKIIDGKMYLSALGKIAEEEISVVNEKRRCQFIEITKYVIMPNHIHMIINIFKPHIFHEYKQEDFSKPVAEAISSVMRSYKAAVTKRVRENSDGINVPYRIWQSRYFDTVIRNEESYRKIYEYIETNPLRWEKDKFYG